MAIAVIMPKAGITVESCIIGEWLMKVGDQVNMGDILFTYETDKASFECESTAAGTLLEIFYEEGDEVPCLLNVCAIGTPGEDVSSLKGGTTTPEAPAAPPAETLAPAVPAAPAAASPIEKVIMPKAGITVESCIIGEWLKQVGDDIKVGDILFAYETDKASFECESTAAGKLLEIYFEAGDEVPCLEPVCGIGVAGAAVSVASNAPVSPRAKKLAASAGVDASLATGTGPNGRIIERDVRDLIVNPPAAAAAPVAAPAAAPVAAAPAPAAVPAPVAAAAGETEYKDVKFSGIRRAISKSMSTSLHTMAQLTHNTSFDATAILNYRKALKAAGGEYALITLGDIVLYAVSRTLLNYPDLNANMLDDNNIRLFNHVNLGVAVDTPRGLMVPTIRHADEMSLLEISKAVKELAAECRSGAISPDKLSGGSFTVSNLGNMDVESFTPVINPPQTGILGVCGTIDRVRKGKDGGIEMYPAMGLSLTYDHRAVDGTPAAKFQKELGFNLENFTVLLSK